MSPTALCDVDASTASRVSYVAEVAVSSATQTAANSQMVLRCREPSLSKRAFLRRRP
jgi:hypothetical protein